MIAVIAYVVYLVLLIIAFVIIKFIVNKLFSKEFSKKKSRIVLLVFAVLPLILFKSCQSCMDSIEDDVKDMRCQESYVRKFLEDNEASSLVLPKFKVNSYEHESSESYKWTIEFEEPMDETSLKKIDQSGVASVDGKVLFFPIVLEGEEMTEVVDPETVWEEREWSLEDKYNNEEDPDEYVPDYKYDYRNFKLELMPDGKTAILLYSLRQNYKTSSSSGSSHHHHHHHHDD